jgi:hypothetical protein
MILNLCPILSKSVENIADMAIRQVMKVIEQELPQPECPRSRPQNNWKKEQVKKLVAQRLWPADAGVKISITP